LILNSEALPCHAENVGPGRTKHPRSFLFSNSLRLLETVPFPPPAWGTVAEEYQRVLAELSQEFPQINGQPFLDLLAHWGELIQPNPVASPICRDPAHRTVPSVGGFSMVAALLIAVHPGAGLGLS
jgi:hypothetical protein